MGFRVVDGPYSLALYSTDTASLSYYCWLKQLDMIAEVKDITASHFARDFVRSQGRGRLGQARAKPVAGSSSSMRRK